MTEERLKEIKNSIDFQVAATKAYEYDETLINEELELYNEVVRLRKIIKEAKDEIKKYKYTDNWGDTVVLAKYLEDILKQSNITLEQLNGIENE